MQVHNKLQQGTVFIQKIPKTLDIFHKKNLPPPFTSDIHNLYPVILFEYTVHKNQQIQPSSNSACNFILFTLELGISNIS